MKLTGATRRRFEAKAQMMKALAHPTRLFMVEQLSKGEHCVCELRDMVGADISTVSKHLALLKTAGSVADNKQGLQVFGARSRWARRLTGIVFVGVGIYPTRQGLIPCPGGTSGAPAFSP